MDGDGVGRSGLPSVWSRTVIGPTDLPAPGNPANDRHMHAWNRSQSLWRELFLSGQLDRAISCARFGCGGIAGMPSLCLPVAGAKPRSTNEDPLAGSAGTASGAVHVLRAYHSSDPDACTADARRNGYRGLGD